MKLNIGCGNHRAPEPWINVDIQPDLEPDVVASITALPFDDDSVTDIYCGHVLEHVLFDELPVALAEVRRVLARDGRACFVGPDYDRALANEEWHPLLSVILEGGGRWSGDEHHWASTGRKALTAVQTTFPDAFEIDVAMVGDSWPIVDRVGWQFAILIGASSA